MVVSVLSAILVIFLALWAHDALLRQEITKQYPPLGRLVEFDGGTLHIMVDGTASSLAPIVLIHGSSGSARDVHASLASELKEKTMVYAIDRPGIGYSQNQVSDQQLAHPADQGKAIMQALAALGVKNPVIFGHSWGGTVAVSMAMNYGEELSGVLAAAPPLYPWRGGASWYERLVTTPIIGTTFAHLFLTKFGMTQLGAGIERNFHPELAPPNYSEMVGLPLILRPRTFTTNAVYSMSLNANVATMSQSYHMPSCPLVLASGNRDLTVNYKTNISRFHADFPETELVIFDQAGHMIHHTQAKPLADKLLALATR